jgi:hypothetical protein
VLHQLFSRVACSENGRERSTKSSCYESFTEVFDTQDLLDAKAIPFEAVHAVHSRKVIFDCGKLDPSLRRAIGHAHDAEEPGL